MKNIFKKNQKVTKSNELKPLSEREAVIPDWMDSAFHSWEKEKDKRLNQITGGNSAR